MTMMYIYVYAGIASSHFCIIQESYDCILGPDGSGDGKFQ